MKKVQDCSQLVIYCLINVSSPPIVAHPPGVPWQRKRSPEDDTQDNPPAKTVARWDLTDSENIVWAVSVPSSDPVVSGGAVATERSPSICESELCGVSPPSVRLGWNTTL